jgi:AcrR family transcriptional regulator
MKQDRRITRTRAQLRDSLWDLILKQGYDAITISDITEHADLGRTTFYLHYKDKDDLLTQSIDEVAAELVQRLDAFQPGVGKLKPATELIFEHAAENAEFYQILLQGHGVETTAGRVQEIINHHITQGFEIALQQLGGNAATLALPLPLLIQFFSTSLLGIVIWWLENEMPFSPQEIADQYYQLLMHGIGDTLRPAIGNKTS